MVVSGLVLNNAFFLYFPNHAFPFGNLWHRGPTTPEGLQSIKSRVFTPGQAAFLNVFLWAVILGGFSILAPVLKRKLWIACVLYFAVPILLSIAFTLGFGWTFFYYTL